VATSAPQIEGAVGARGRSVWDAFAAEPGRVFEGHGLWPACDHVARYAEDVALMRELGVNAYRFSVAWPRVLPEGPGRVSDEGVGFYDRLVDALLEAGIEPFLTLFHWDFPYDLYLRGGWLSPDSPGWFSDYADLLARRLGDRVRNWITQNEPSCFLGDGHVSGTHAPGLKLPWPEFLIATKHALLAHGDAVAAIRASAARARVGVAVCAIHGIPASDDPADVAANERYTFEIGPWTDRRFWHQAPYLEPMLRGVWAVGEGEPTPDELRRMSRPLDFLGLNVYSAPYIRSQEDGAPTVVQFTPGWPRSAFAWPVTPEAMAWAARLHSERYSLPIVFTENGMACLDWPDEAGKVRDPQRVDYLRRHVSQVLQLRDAGVPVEGYFHWTLCDNFEWAEGYRMRFGLVHVDFSTQRRTPKDSFWAYRELIQRGFQDLQDRHDL
jgi:beta-glucosidase